MKIPPRQATTTNAAPAINPKTDPATFLPAEEARVLVAAALELEVDDEVTEEEAVRDADEVAEVVVVVEFCGVEDDQQGFRESLVRRKGLLTLPSAATWKNEAAMRVRPCV